MILNIVSTSCEDVLATLKATYPDFVIDNVESLPNCIHLIHIHSNKPSCISLENLQDILYFIKPWNIRIMV